VAFVPPYVVPASLSAPSSKSSIAPMQPTFLSEEAAIRTRIRQDTSHGSSQTAACDAACVGGAGAPIKAAGSGDPRGPMLGLVHGTAKRDEAQIREVSRKKD